MLAKLCKLLRFMGDISTEYLHVYFVSEANKCLRENEIPPWPSIKETSKRSLIR